MEKSDMEATATTSMQYCSCSTEKLGGSAVLAWRPNATTLQHCFFFPVLPIATDTDLLEGQFFFFRFKAKGLIGGQLEAERGGVSGG